MDTLTIEKQNALKAHSEANDKGKTLLENLFGKKVFQKKVTDRIKTYEDACEELGISPSNWHISFVKDEAGDANSIIAFGKLQIIARALNEGWQPNWDNSGEYKYYPWFYMSPSGFRYNVCANDCTFSFVGSRLCFKSKELAIYAGQQFLSLYKDFMTIQ